MIHYFLIHYDSLCSFAEILAHEPHSIERMCGQGSCELFYLYRMVALDHPIKFQREYFFISRSSMKFSDFFLPLPWQCLCRSLSKLYPEDVQQGQGKDLPIALPSVKPGAKWRKTLCSALGLLGFYGALGSCWGLTHYMKPKGTPFL